jgi:ATP-binding protein involved in chromosome partitioning
VPIIGVVENMSGDIFGSGGGEEAAALHVDFLARIPLDSRVRSGGDSGDPIVYAGAGERHRDSRLPHFARVVAAKLSVMNILPEPQLKVV